VGSVKLINNIINQLGTPAFNSNTLANRPAAGYVGRIFISTDTFKIQRDNGTGWDDIGGGLSGSGATGQVTFFTGASAISGDNAFFWDNTNKRLGLGTITPGVRLDIHGTGVIQQLNGTTTNSAFLDFQNAGTSRWRVGNNYNGAANDYVVFNNNTLINSTVIKNNGQMLFNSSDLSASPVNNFIEFYRYNSTAIAIGIIDYSNANNGNGINFLKTRGTSKGTYSATLNADALGVFSAYGSTNSGFTGSSYFGVYQIGTVATYAPGEVRFEVTNGSSYLTKLLLSPLGYTTFIDRVNVNNATDNANFELNNNGNLYTGGISPTILTVGVNTNMARTVTGYRCTGTLTLTLPVVSGLNQWYIVINDSAGTVTINRNGTDTIVNTAGTSVTSLTLAANARTMLYLGGGTITYQIF
jgi:hypothetical protein